MSVFTLLRSSVLRILQGEGARQKFLFRQQTKKETQRLKNYWQQTGSPRLDEVELNSWHRS